MGPRCAPVTRGRECTNSVPSIFIEVTRMGRYRHSHAGHEAQHAQHRHRRFGEMHGIAWHEGAQLTARYVFGEVHSCEVLGLCCLFTANLWRRAGDRSVSRSVPIDRSLIRGRRRLDGITHDGLAPADVDQRARDARCEGVPKAVPARPPKAPPIAVQSIAVLLFTPRITNLPGATTCLPNASGDYSIAVVRCPQGHSKVSSFRGVFTTIRIRHGTSALYLQQTNQGEVGNSDRFDTVR